MVDFTADRCMICETRLRVNESPIHFQSRKTALRGVLRNAAEGAAYGRSVIVTS